jgi:hypothetical protein
VITIKAHGWHQFLAAFGVLRAAGVEPVASGGNQMRVPDDTDRALLRAVTATGAVVDADLTEPAPTPDAAADGGEVPAPEPDGDEPGGESEVVEAEDKPQVDTPPDTDAAASKRTPRKTTRRKTKEQ